MAMPRKLKLMNVFLNGYSYQGVAKSVTLPKLTRKLENYRGAGMNGSAPVDLGLDDDALSMEWSLGGFPDSVIWELYAATGVDAVPIRFAGSYQRQTSVIQIPGVTHGLIENTVEILNQTGDMAYFGNATKIMSTFMVKPQAKISLA